VTNSSSGLARKSPRHARTLAAGMAALALSLTALPAEAQFFPGSRSPQAADGDVGFELQLLTGRSLYDRDFGCGFVTAFLNGYELTATLGGIGLSAAYVLDYPWPLPPPPPFVYRDRGGAVQAMVEVYPLRFLPQGSDLDRFVRPFLAGGVMVSRTGEAQAAGTRREEPVYAVQGSIHPGLSFGANFTYPLGDGPLAAVLQFRRTLLFDVAGDYVGPQGDQITTEGENLSWNDIRAGISFRPGR
jgi:hypothetical protein